MLRGKRTRKGIALTFLVILLTNTLAPLSAYALTSGPTAPEATSFEPVDTTDMVNLVSGDFTYNIPLMEVPGPEGGYPLSLSYHAGIQPNEDASWVGLGWTLNPGAINRSVNGYPDDWWSHSGSSHVYWNGGTTTTYTAGVSIGIANTPATVGFGLSVSHDTYHGFSTGMYMRAGTQMGPFNLGISYSNDTRNNEQFSVNGGVGVGLPIGQSGLNASLGVGFETNFESTTYGVHGGIGYKMHKGIQHSLLGASISSDGNKPSIGIGGLTASVQSTTAAKVQTKTKGFHIDIPIYPGISASLGYSKTRYWTNETSTTILHGSLYNFLGSYQNYMVTDNNAFDSYALLEDLVYNGKSIATYPDPTRLQGGAYPDYDSYTVMAQGLGGSMRPYQFQGQIMGQNQKNSNGSALVTYYNPSVVDRTPEFRFIGDFSNSYRQNYSPYSNMSVNLRSTTPPMDPNPVFGDNDGDFGYGNTNANNKLAGSKHIEIGALVKPSNIQGYNKNDKYLDHMIEGFSITNESGVTYHYGLPAYSWGEEIYQQKNSTLTSYFLNTSNSLSFNRQTKTTPYAYTWYLTSITGPDFVDRDGDSKAGVSDWGYWVNFEYGKWSNNYVWRNPSEGYHRDEDNEWKGCSMGKKEVYYLNAIRSRTHIALFEKDIRKDGKGVSPESFNTYNQGSTRKNYENDGLFNTNSAQSLRLSKIYLLNLSDAGTVLPGSGNANAYKPSYRSISCSDCELASNILDKTDIDAAGRFTLEAKAIRIIDFYQDFSICPSTSNSYDIESPSTKYGKLTLNALLFRGKGGASFLPPTKFEYELSSVDQKTGSATIGTATNEVSDLQTSLALERGDLLNIGSSHFASVTETPATSGNGQYKIRWTAGATAAPGSGTYNISTTKNPPYNKNAYDAWNMYKSDIDNAFIDANYNTGRRTSPVSAKGVDAWSLRKIISPLGGEVKVEYESDEFSKSVLNDNYSYKISTASKDGTNNKIVFKIQTGSFSLGEVTNIGGKGYLYLVFQNSSYPYVQLHQTSFAITNIATDGSIYATLESALPSTSTTLTGGNVSLSSTMGKYGGGIRVSGISTKDENGSTVKTSYKYVRPGTTNTSSGVTSYMPGVFDDFDPNLSSAFPKYKERLYHYMHSLLAISREVISPGVMYEYTTVSNEVKNADEAQVRTIEGKTQYQFEVFRENMIYRQFLGEQDNTSLGAYAYNWAIRKFTSCLGNVRSIIQFDKDGRKLTETKNHYLHDGLENHAPEDFMSNYYNKLSQFKYQGFIQERYAEIKEVPNYNGSAFDIRSTLAAREDYPNIQTGQTIINYVNGTQVKSENLAFDFYSGALTKTVETDVYGNRFLIESIPAYRRYNSLGLKVHSDYNKNMLTQTAETYMYKVDGNNNKLGLVSAQVQTWSNGVTALDKDGTAYIQNNGTDGRVWRMQSSYSWLPDAKTADGMTAIGSFSDFNFTTPSSSNAAWKKTSEITLYDVYSHGLEATDIYNNYVATRMDYGNKKIILSGGPANYYEMAFSGAEDDALNNNIEGFVWKNGGTASTDHAHTGTKSLNVTGNGNGFTYTVSTNKLVGGKDYMASVWVKPITALGQTANQYLLYQINGVTKASVSRGTKQSNGWYLLMLKISGADITPGSTLKVICSNAIVSSGWVAYMDDFRFQPFSSATTAYVYDPFTGELAYMLDNNNQYTKYEYDVHGKLLRTYRESLTNGVYKTAEFAYNYSAPKYGSAVINGYYNKSDCPTGQSPVPYYVYLAPDYFTSLVSQQIANQMAEEEAQRQANQYGSCQTTVPIYYSNAASECYIAHLDNLTTGQIWYISIPSGSGTLGYVPPGTYNIQIYGGYSCDYGNCRTFSVNSSSDYNCNYAAYFSGATINSSYNYININ